MVIKMAKYTQEQEAIRQAIANFLGALLMNSMFTKTEAKENVIAIFCEELVKYISDDGLDIQAAKPLLKSTLWILQKRKEELNISFNELGLDNIPVNSDLDQLIELLNNYINKL